MSNILVVTDTTSSLSFEQAEAIGVELVPLSIEIDQVVYKDFIDLTHQELQNKLREGAIPKTSQPNIGYVEELMENWKKANYDAIIIITISAGLSGTFQGFNLIANQLEMDNVYVINSHTLGGPLVEGAILAKNLANKGVAVEEIVDIVTREVQDSKTYIYPKTLDQLKKGGRISPIVANMSALLKIKPLLAVAEDGSTIEKFGVARTENKIYDIITKDIKTRNVNADDYVIYIAHAVDNDELAKVHALITDVFPDFTIKVVDLPAVLLSHAGLGCVGIQIVHKG